MHNIRILLLLLAAGMVMCLADARAQNSGTLSPDPTLATPGAQNSGVPAPDPTLAAPAPGAQSSGALAPDPRMAAPEKPVDGSAAAPNADISTTTGAEGSHIMVKPKLNIESEKDPMTDDDAMLKLIASMPDEIQKDLMDEAAFSKDYCEHNAFLNGYYDCSCFSFKIIADRIAKGPKVDTFTLINDGRYGQCVDDAKVAGIGYEKCNAIMNYMTITTQQLNNICECTGRLLASTYRKSPDPVVSQVENLFTDILSECRHREGL